MSEIKMKDCLMVGGKLYVPEAEVRAAVNAALSTNVKRNERIAELEAALTQIRSRTAMGSGDTLGSIHSLAVAALAGTKPHGGGPSE